MPVVVCPMCQAKMNVKEELLGRKGKCPKCANVIALTAAAPPAKEAPIQAKPPAAAVRPKTKPAPPPALPAEPAEDDLDDLEEVAPARPRSRRDRDEEEDDFDDEPKPRRRRQRDEDDDEDDFDDRPRKRSSGKWDGTRTGLQLVFFSVIIVLFSQVVMQIASIFGPAGLIMRQAAGGQPVPPQNLAANFGIFGVVTMILGFVSLIAYVVHFIGHCFCLGAPDAATRSRARISFFTLIGAIVIALIGFCVVAAMVGGAAIDMGQQMQKMKNNPQAQPNLPPGALGNFMAAGAAGIGVLLVAAILGLVYWVFWCLFHASIAGAHRDRALQSQCHIFLAASIVGPILAGIIPGALVAVMQNFAMFIVGTIIAVIIHIAVFGWYLVINRRLVRLIDSGR
jgi:hypothetical protein